MARHVLPLLLLGSVLAHAEPRPAEPDGFRNPLRALDINPGLDQTIFERSTFGALNVDDPFEPFNRRLYHFNYRLDQWVMLPVVRGYRQVVPAPVRSGVSNAFLNLGEIGNLANSLLQGKGRRAMQATARLLFNSILGVGGLWDPATRMGLTRQPEDFGQTLGVYGVPAGPYLILPALGPSNLRDATGLAVDYGLADPLDALHYRDAREAFPVLPALRAVDLRHRTPFRYGQLNSPFEYEQVRYIYSRARLLQIDE